MLVSVVCVREYIKMSSILEYNIGDTWVMRSSLTSYVLFWSCK